MGNKHNRQSLNDTSISKALEHYLITVLKCKRSQAAHMADIDKSDFSRILNGGNLQLNLLERIITALCHFSPTQQLISHACFVIDEPCSAATTLAAVIAKGMERKKASSIDVEIHTGISESRIRELRLGASRSTSLATLDALWPYLFGATASSVISGAILSPKAPAPPAATVPQVSPCGPSSAPCGPPSAPCSPPSVPVPQVSPSVPCSPPSAPVPQVSPCGPLVPLCPSPSSPPAQ